MIAASREGHLGPSSRRINLKGVLAGLVALATTCAVSCAAGTSAVVQELEHPNVLVIITDDQRWDSMRTMPKTKTIVGPPNGRRYTSAVVNLLLCCPARATISSGQFPHNHGVVGESAPASFDRDKTFQRVLKDAGYRTGYFGKYLNGWSQWETFPDSFDEGFVMQPDPNDKSGSFYNNSYATPTGVVTTRETSYSTNFLGRQTRSFIAAAEETDGRPWLAFFAPYAPHFPADPHRRYADAMPTPRANPAQHEDDISDKPGWIRRLSRHQHPPSIEERRNMLRTLLSVDDQIAELESKLEATGELSNTLIVFTSDNGYLWGEHDLSRKIVPYNEAIRVPFYVRWDNHIEPGVDTDTYAQHADIAPTIFDATGIDPPYVVDGQSVLTDFKRNWALIEYPQSFPGYGVPPYRMLWRPDEAFIHYTYRDRREYYGPSDPWQLHNVYRDRRPGNEPVGAAKLESLLTDYADCVGSECP
ncbi:MAG TPA: sulfatase-like hydrolase/transferase [Actinomycetota bacterium]|nr:sulfatase-like hydrolase/transferase [Actinomycetota bacterium]